MNNEAQLFNSCTWIFDILLKLPLILTYLAYRANAKKRVTCISNDIVTVLNAREKRALANVNDVGRGVRGCNAVFTLERPYIFM